MNEEMLYRWGFRMRDITPNGEQMGAPCGRKRNLLMYKATVLTLQQIVAGDSGACCSSACD